MYGENVAGQVLDGRHIDDDVDFTRDAQTVAISFSGFDSPACGIRSYEWALGENERITCMSYCIVSNCVPLYSVTSGSYPGYSDVMPFTSFGIVMLNESHAVAQVELPLSHADHVFASVRAHTGHRCSDAVLTSSSDGFQVDVEAPLIEFTSVGIFENETEELFTSGKSLFQQEVDVISLAWNITDDVEGRSIHFNLLAYFELSAI